MTTRFQVAIIIRLKPLLNVSINNKPILLSQVVTNKKGCIAVAKR